MSRWHLLRTTVSAALLSACSAHADWGGFPLRDSATNYPTWAALVQAYDPISQLWAAACERWEVADPLNSGFTRTLDDSQTATLGTYADVVDYVTATRTNTVTNIVVVTTQLVRTVSIEFADMRDIGPATYTGLDGTQRVARPFVAPDVTAYVDNLFWHAWDVDAPADDALPVDYYVSRSVTTNDSLEEYLAREATNTSGDVVFPDGPPLESMGGIFERAGTGYTPTALTNNAWGYEYLDHRYAPAAFFTTWLDGRNELQVLGSAGATTNGWAYRRNASLVVDPYPYNLDSAAWVPGDAVELFGQIVEFDAAPVGIKTRGTTNATATGSATVYGWALLTNELVRAGASAAIMTNVVESATFTSNGAPLAYAWVHITNIIPATATETGVTYAVVYDSPVSRWHHGDLAPADLITALDEQQAYLTAMDWTTQPVTYPTNYGGGTYTWTGWGWSELDGPVTNSTDPQAPGAWVEYAASTDITGGSDGEDAWVEFAPETRAGWDYRVVYEGTLYFELSTPPGVGTNVGDTGDVMISWLGESNVVAVGNVNDCDNPITGTHTYGPGTAIVSRACDTYTNALTGPTISAESSKCLFDITSISVDSVTPWLEAKLYQGAIDVYWDTWQTNAAAKWPSRACALDLYAGGKPPRAGTNGVTCAADPHWTNHAATAVAAPPTPYEIMRTNGTWQINGRYARVLSVAWPGGIALPYTNTIGEITPPWVGESFDSRAWNFDGGAFWVMRWTPSDGGYWQYE